MWLAGYGTQSHYIYFGTNKTAITNADSASPELIRELNAPANIVNLPKELKPEMTYYWQVDSSKVNKGQVWQFKCK